MRQIKYNATQTLRLDFPSEWDSTAVSAVSLTILDRDASVLLAAASMTMYTATALAADANRYSDSITLATGAVTLLPGDVLSIAGIEGPEIVRIKGYKVATRVATLEQILDNNHLTGDVVRAKFATISVSTAVTATFTAGLPVTLLWTPTPGQAFTEEAVISKTSLQVSGLEERFEAIYKRAYDDMREPMNKFRIFRDEAERQLNSELSSNGLDINRIVDTDGMIGPVLMARMAYLWTLNGDENKEDERKALGSEYNALMAQLIANPIWADSDQDLVEDDPEVSNHPQNYERGW